LEIVSDKGKVESMSRFSFYKLNETANGVEVILYLNDNLTEFSMDLESDPTVEKQDIEKEAVEYVRKVVPSIKVTTVKIMAGAILVTSFGIGVMSPKKAAAAEPSVVQHHETSPSYTVTSGDTLWSIAARHNTTVHAIKQANNLSSDHLRLGQILMLPATTSSKVNTISYKVGSGDTLYSMASRFGTSVSAIKQANRLTSDRLSIGQTLLIPTSTTSNQNSSLAQTNSTSYQVISGDTLYSIAVRYGTTVNAIKQTNKLTSDILSIGQILTVPSRANPPVTNPTSYQVIAGDTLYSIAKRFGTTVQAIKQASHLTSVTLSLGQRLTIPSGTTKTPTTEPVQTMEQSTGVSMEDLQWLAKMIHSEGRGESIEGQVAVGAVIMNRVKSPLFPNNIKDVLFEVSNGYYQFTPAETGVLHSATPNSQNMDAAIRAAKGEDPTNGALFFYNPNKTNSLYLRSRTVSTTIGNHVFAY
jgi:N-acetylmuramoyl-L-alanine amidase